MSMCEKCWGDAFAEAHHRGGSQTEHYQRLLDERAATPCTPEERAGQWWDEERQCDSRIDGAFPDTSHARTVSSAKEPE